MMPKIAAIFPGQGSQSVGMGRSLYDANPEVKRWFEKADDILGFSLTKIMFEGPMEVLTQTQHTQPAMYLHSVAAYHAHGVKADMAAGHSLGEFSALTVAGVIPFEEGLKLVHLRGQSMQQAGEDFPGAMAAVIGLQDSVVEEVCATISAKMGEPVVAANYNSVGQLVISGAVDAVESAMEELKSAGSRLVKRLPVSGAFHSPLMQSAHASLAAALDSVEFRQPAFPVYSNYTALPSLDADILKSNALHQLLNPVRWTQTLVHMYDDDARTFIECGPGNVLRGLVTRTLKEVVVQGVD